MIPLFVGAILAAAVGLFAHLIGYDRDCAFYPTVLTVVGALYALFAVMAGGGGLPTEIAFFVAFAGLAAIGFKSSLWIVAAGLALHGLFDFVRSYVSVGPGAPSWWPAFCGSYDVVAACGLATILLTKREGSNSRTG